MLPGTTTSIVQPIVISSTAPVVGSRFEATSFPIGGETKVSSELLDGYELVSLSSSATLAPALVVLLIGTP
jgi:hypothetical protein